MQCPKCGIEIQDEEANFCPRCGTALMSSRKAGKQAPKATPRNLSRPEQRSAAAGPVSFPERIGRVWLRAKEEGWGALAVPIVFVILAAVAVCVLWPRGGAELPQSAVSAVQPTAAAATEEPVVQEEAAAPTPAITPAATPVPADTPQPEPESTPAVSEETVAEESEYILPHSDTEPITLDQLQGLTAEQARIARNEILARHGRRFLDQGLQSHFDSCSWYVGTTDPEDFDYNVLSALEQQNVEVIKEYEASLAG